jgi:threonylcarbamoyladenosine tRNA methylthiotransferase MtaB
MPQVPARLRRDRAAALRRAGADARARYLAGRLGAVLDVVVERSPAEGGGAITGRAPDYASVIVPEAAGRVAAGTILPVVVTGSDGERLLARVRQPEAGVGG